MARGLLAPSGEDMRKWSLFRWYFGAVFSPVFIGAGVGAEASVWCAMCSEEERRWLAEAVERHMAEDVVSHLREIALLMSTPLSVLEAQGITPDDIEGTDSVIDTC
jgi:hypothetical protein